MIPESQIETDTRTTPHQQGDAVRETVARMIEPAVWEYLDAYVLRHDADRAAVLSRSVSCQSSLQIADQILSTLTAPPNDDARAPVSSREPDPTKDQQAQRRIESDWKPICTPIMAKAGRQALRDLGYEDVAFTDAQKVYAAMLAVAPTTQEVKEDGR